MSNIGEQFWRDLIYDSMGWESSDNSRFFEEELLGVNEMIRGMTPLQLSVKQNHMGSAMYLISKGAKLDVQDRFGKTALHYAVAGNKIEMVAILIRSCADCLVADSDGNTPMDIAVNNDYQGVIKLLEPIYQAALEKASLDVLIHSDAEEAAVQF